jgi:SAM-dependent methyltransferase
LSWVNLLEYITMDDRSIREALSRYRFYHCIRVTDTIRTAGETHLESLQAPFRKLMESIDFNGLKVLDIGCRDGLFSFLAEKLGAAEITGIDGCLSKGATEFLIPFFQSKVRMVEKNLLDLTADDFGRFDVVLFPGVLYHLRYPIWGLDRIRRVMKPGGRLLIETAVYRGHEELPLLYCPVGKESPYEPTSVTFFNQKGLRDTLLSLGFETESFDYLDGHEPIDRAVMSCRWRPELVPPLLEEYWNGHTRWHDMDKADRLKAVQGNLKPNV